MSKRVLPCDTRWDNLSGWAGELNGETGVAAQSGMQLRIVHCDGVRTCSDALTFKSTWKYENKFIYRALPQGGGDVGVRVQICQREELQAYAAVPLAAVQGHTLVHFSTQRKHFLWDTSVPSWLQ